MNPEEQASNAMARHPDRVAGAIKRVFDHPEGDVVLAWLADTCGATTTTIDESPLIMAAAEGRRQVWVALNTILSMSERDIAHVRRQVAAWEADQ